MDDTAKSAAEARTAEAIRTGAFADFREAYRERLRWLKESRPQAFAEALTYYDALVKNIAAGDDPIHEWLTYGKRLGELSGAGKVVAIDETGRALPATQFSDQLLLHLPDDINVPALPLAVPRALSEHQKATLDLLVRRRLAIE
jgi:hypothetical protein